MAGSSALKAESNEKRGMEWVFSPKQLLSMYWWDMPEFQHCVGIICDGAVRSGKTISLITGFMMWSMETYNDRTFGLCGKTVKSFERNVLQPMKQIVESLGYALAERKTDHAVILLSPSGRRNTYYIFGGNDERSQDLIQGITLAGVYLDEVALMPESFVNQALARLSVTGAKVWMNCNPENPSHFVKREFIDNYQRRSFLHIHFVLDDNLSLSEERRRFYMAQWTGVFFRRYILGEWCLASGLVFSSFIRERMVFSGEIDRKLYADYWISGDYGTMNPTAVLLIGYNRLLRTFDIIDEYYYDGRASMHQKTDDEYVRDIAAFSQQYRVHAAFFDPSAASLIAALRKAHIFQRLVQADNDVLPGIRFTSMLFSMGRIRVAERCRNTIRELESYAWDEEKSIERGEDIVLKENDHTCDALRYFCYTEVYRRAKLYGVQDTRALVQGGGDPNAPMVRTG